MGKKHAKSREKQQSSEQSSDSHGRIGRLDEHTLSYYRRVNQTLSNGFSDDQEEKELFLKNVFTTLSEEALEVAQNQTASNIIEQLLCQGDLKQLISFGAALSKDWELACTDRFASHVTQTFLLQLAVGLSNGAESSDAEFQRSKEQALEQIVQVYGFLMSNLAYHMQNTYTSHIVRVLLEILAGHQVSENVIRSRVARKAKGNNPDSRGPVKLCQMGIFPELLLEMCTKIAELRKIRDHVKNNLSNPVLQTMLLVLNKNSPEKCNQVCRDLIRSTELFATEEEVSEESEGQTSLPELVQDEIASHFVEQIFTIAAEPLLQELLENHLESKLLTMAVHPVANFVLQKLIKNVHTSEQFEMIYKKLCKHLESILGMEHPQVIVSLAEGCLKHGTKQQKFLKALMKAFHCHEPPERQIKCVPLFASLTTYDTFYKTLADGAKSDEDDDSKDEEIHFPELKQVNFHGSLLLQKLLNFGNPKAVLSSLLQMKISELKHLSCDPCGSHVIDAFVKSSSVGEKSTESLFQRLKGSFLELACHKHGSRTLDNLFLDAPMRQKVVIVEELSKHEDKLRGDYIGRIIYHKYNVANFQRNRQQWKQIQGGRSQKRKMMEEIFSQGQSQGHKAGKKKKKRNKIEEDDELESNSLRLQDSDDDDVIDEILPSKVTDNQKSMKYGKHHKKKGKPNQKNFGKAQGKTHDKKAFQKGYKQGQNYKGRGHKDKMDIIKDKDMKSLLNELDSKPSKKKRQKTT